MPTTDQTKQRLRRKLRERRNHIDPGQRASAGRCLYGHVSAIPGWDRLQHVAGYIAADAEIDPASLLEGLHETGKQLYLPVIQDDNSLLFAAWMPGDTLVPNRYGIPEPRAEAQRRRAAELEAILLPLVGWDKLGRRLRMGGGFYDRSLVDCKDVLKVGLAYAVQEVRALPAEPWDIALDFVVTESALHACRASA